LIVSLLNKISKYNFFTFIGIFFFCLLIWTLLFGIPLTTLYGSYDLFGHVSFVSEILFRGSGTEQLLYSNFKIGGTALGPVDTPYYLILFNWFIDSPIKIVNLSIILTQTCLGYFTLGILRSNSKSHHQFIPILGMLLACFLPSMGWRYFYGHLNLVWGCVIFLSIAFYFSQIRNNKLSIFDLLLIFIVFIIGLHSINLIQTGIYSFICLFLFLIFTFRSSKEYFKLNYFIPLMFLFLSSLLFCFNHLSNVFVYLKDLQRSLNGNIIYSYTTQNFSDYLGSILYGLKTFNTNRNFFLLHETNLGFGFLPFLTISVLILLKNIRLLGLISACLIFGVILSSNISPFSDLLLALFPFLKSFRVPSRIFLPFTILSNLIFCYGLDRYLTKSELPKSYLIIVFAGFACPFLFQANIDLGAAVFLLIILFFYFLFKQYRKYFLYFFIGFFIGLNFTSFIEKRPEVFVSDFDLKLNKDIFIKANNKTTDFLSHHSTSVYANHFATHQASIFNYYGVDANLPATKRFSDFYGKMTNTDNGANTNYTINSKAHSFNLFQRLLNIEGEYIFNNQIQYQSFNYSKPYFSPQKIVVVKNLDDFSGKISATTDFTNESFIENHLTDYQNLKVCDYLNLIERNERMAKFHVKTQSPCLIALATNFSPFIALTNLENNELQRAFPINWIMSGFHLKPGDYKFEVSAKSIVSNEFLFRTCAFGFLFFGIWIFYRRRQKGF
jgi:hypothetical protein